ncbi:putative RNA-directed DNA polymerase [Lupinus albus]|uniref:Putative RNA-directed DNA polymerase n=1 Tax=Lupinus albus TaxID=3870 RepID=A0A6A4NCX9_LUPAL|nr:putative RNA-directed DNA polymerase [Lupinus albus]
MGYKQSSHDHSLFTKASSNSFTALLIYVDNLILAGNNISQINLVKHQLHHMFKIKDLGPLKYFLGLEICRSSKGIILSQRKYALDILANTGFLASKPTATPIAEGTTLSLDASGAYSDPTSYRRLVGRLLYFTNSRPDLSFGVQQLSQFMSNPTNAHHQALTRILRYIKSSPGQGLFYPSTLSLQLKAFSDSDWATCIDSRHFVSGFCIFLCHFLVSWRTKKQTTVVRSSCEAEYIALAATTCEIQWLSFLLESFPVSFIKPTLLYYDNDSAHYIEANSMFHERTKHIEIDCHIVRERLQTNLFHLLPILTSE